MNQFCPNCGTQISEDGGFCPNCGTKVAPAAPQPVQQYPQQYPQQYAPKTPGSFLDNLSKKFNLSKTALIGIAGGAVALIVAIILIICLTGGPSVIKDYKYKDIQGEYEGEATVNKIKLSYDLDTDELDDLADELDMDLSEIKDMIAESFEEMEEEAADMEGETMDCTITVSKDEIKIWMEEYVFMDSRTCTLEDVTFEKGVAKGEVELDDYGTVEYKLYLQEAETKKADYRITGTVEVNLEEEEEGAYLEFSCSFDVDVEY